MTPSTRCGSIPYVSASPEKRTTRSGGWSSVGFLALGSIASQTSHGLLAQVVRAAGATAVTDQQHEDSLAETTDPGMGPARFVAHGLLSLRSDARLRQAAVSHVGVLQTLDGESRGTEFSFETYAKAVCRYWTDAVERAPFQFTPPGELRRATTEEAARAPLLRAKAILLAVLSSLPARVPQDSLAWLNSSNPQAASVPNS